MGASTSHRKKRSRTARDASATKGSSTPTQSSISPLPDASVELQLHDCAFIPWDVSGLVAVASNPSGTLLAAGRANGHLELRRKSNSWAVVDVHYGDAGVPELSITALGFSVCSRFLFVTRLDGSLGVLRVGAEGMSEHVVLRPGGGGIWDLDVRGGGGGGTSRVALACDDGCVRFVEAEAEFVEMEMGGGVSVAMMPADPAHYIVTISEGTKARMLSVAWAPDGEETEECVVTGDAEGGVRWIDPRSGKVYGRGKIPSLRGEHAKIWTLAFVAGGRELVCGDSRGTATLWSCRTNTMKQEIKIEGLKGAFWSSVALREGEREVVLFGSASGGIGGLQAAGKGGDQIWVPLRGLHVHSHDTRGLVSTADGAVVSVSMDARMCRFTLSDFVDRRKFEWILPYPGCVGQLPVQFCKKYPLILSRRRHGVDLWCLPSGKAHPSLKLRMRLKSFSTEIIACAISDNATLVAASGYDAFRLYTVWDGEGEATAAAGFGKVEMVSVEPTVDTALQGAVDLGFCGETLACISRCKKSVVFFANGVLRTFKMSNVGSTALALEHIVTGPGIVAVSDSTGHVFCTRIDGLNSVNDDPGYGTWFSAGNKPDENESTITAMSFSEKGEDRLAIATGGGNVFSKVLQKDKEGDWAHVGHFPAFATSLSFSGSGEVLLVSGEKFCALAASAGVSRKRRSGEDTARNIFKPQYVRVGDSILGSGLFHSSDIVVVRRRWEQVQTSLGEAVPRRPFGT